MLTIASAAARLAAVASLDDLERLVGSLGFTTPALPLDDDTRARLGMPDAIADVRVAAGAGALRALLVELPEGNAPRTAFAPLASRLASRTPHVLWVLAAVERGGTRLGLACFTTPSAGSGRAGARAPRVVALAADRRRIVASDAETLRALAAAASPAPAADGQDLLLHARWVELLGREALTRRFYRALESTVARLAHDARGPGTDAERGELALLVASRLLFLAFLEAKGWLDGDHGFLARRFDDAMSAGGGVHRRLLLPLFFGTLNTPPSRRAAAARSFGRIPFLNGGLFAVTALERRLRSLRFDDAGLGAFVGDLLGGYRFTAHEESEALAEAAVDPEMLGRAFETLMASQARRETGAFFTPQRLVARVTDSALADALHVDGVPADAIARALDGDPDAAATPGLRARLRELTVLDPACGSGAFLVHALERLAALDAVAGDGRDTATLRRDRLTRSIFGVDCNPTAVWLCELRLWLSVVVEYDVDDPLRVPPLPNLDRNVRIGDALAGGTFDELSSPFAQVGGRAVVRLRERYVRATGARKATLARALDREERQRALRRTDALLAAAVAERREMLLALRARDLFGERAHPTGADRARLLELRERVASLRHERRRLAEGGALPFRFAVHFADAARDGGFRLVVGNPPWVRLHRIPPAARERLRREFVTYREAAWEPGASRANAGRGFAAQVDLAALFTERALHLLRPGGTLAFLLPAKLWRTLAGGGVRRLLSEQATLRTVEDWSESRDMFDAAVYPSLLVARRRERGDDDRRAAPVTLALQRAASTITWCAPAAEIALDDTPGSPWLLLPSAVRAGFERLRRAGVPLADGHAGPPQLGVKSGCNDCFLVAVESIDDGLARVVAPDGRRGLVETSLLRPLVAGHALAPWRADGARAHLLWTHAENLAPLERLPPHAARWLAPWRPRLERRADARGRGRWWSLFRVDAADASRPRVVWGDVGRAPRAAVLRAGDRSVPLNSCYVLRCTDMDDAHALAALLNGPLASAWLAALAEPARGGYHRYLGWTVGLLPLPRDWPRARALLAPLGRRGDDGSPPDAGELLEASIRAYRVGASSVAPLLTWFQ